MITDLAAGARRAFAFGPFVLVPERQLLLDGGMPVRIGGRALDILTALVEHPGQLVSKGELISRVWPDTIVDDGNLKVNMAALRRALAEEPGAAQYIATVIGKGYRFVAQVRAFSQLAPQFEPGAALVRSHNLPTGTTRIFGRADAIDAIRRDLDESRLVSVVGAGGIGKTTVALAVAEQAVELFADGVWLVDLALQRDSAWVPNAIASALGVAVNSSDVLSELVDFLGNRELLLVLDNCEHLIGGTALSVDRILARTAGVKIVATTREPLRVKGERVRRLAGLDAPASVSTLSAAEALTFPAVQLFVDRASSSFEAFQLNDADAPTVAEICRRLDGLALAIEFAATRIDAFGVGGLLKQLDDRFRLLVGRRAGPERQRTLTATLDWSYGLLSASEAALLRAVSVFAGAFDMRARPRFRTGRPARRPMPWRSSPPNRCSRRTSMPKGLPIACWRPREPIASNTCGTARRTRWCESATQGTCVPCSNGRGLSGRGSQHANGAPLMRACSMSCGARWPGRARMRHIGLFASSSRSRGFCFGITFRTPKNAAFEFLGLSKSSRTRGSRGQRQRCSFKSLSRGPSCSRAALRRGS